MTLLYSNISDLSSVFPKFRKFGDIMFTERFNELLKSRGINAVTLAKEIGVPKSIVYEWKSGVRDPSLENMLRIADYFGVSLEYLTGREDEETDIEKELLVLLRAARDISVEDHDALVNSFKSNLNIYLRSNDRSKKEAD
ncbi:MAG: helix-turn-helix transcriptional regulator [Ruminococcaceae bacterium]|nr:helix-turn-helix transcriptional regulator [Oscillospiraceae bacterium]